MKTGTKLSLFTTSHRRRVAVSKVHLFFIHFTFCVQNVNSPMSDRKILAKRELKT